ncbi:MAG: hypothetical protein AABX85_04445 [Nanoarchaeota archaeon]
MAKYAARIIQRSSFKKWMKRFEFLNPEKLRFRYDYIYFAANDDVDAEKTIRRKFGDYEISNPRTWSLEFKRCGERQWLPGPFSSKVSSDMYFPTFDELEDWENRQLLLFSVEKKRFTLRIKTIDEDGWRSIPNYERFKSFFLQDAIMKVKKVYFGIDLKNNLIADSPNNKGIASLEIKSRDRKWISISDKGTPERPAGQALANLHGKSEEGVAFYAFSVLAKWGRRIKKEEECFPALRRGIWDLTEDLENNIEWLY